MVDHSFSLLFFFPFLLSLLSGGESLSDYLNPEIYWQNQGVAFEVEALSVFLQESATDLEEVEIHVQQLGADRFEDREAASKALKKAGSAAKEQLQAAARSPDPEIAQRARTLLQEVREVDPAVQRRNQWMAIHSLGQLEDPAAKEVLRSIADSREGERASHAAKVLKRSSGKSNGAIIDEQSIPPGLPETTVGVLQVRPGQGLPPLEDFIRSSSVLQRTLLDFIVGAGDMRIHRVTLAVEEALLLNPSSGHLLGLFELDYDVERLSAYLTEHRFDRTTAGELELYRLHSITVVPLGPDKLLVVMNSPRSAAEWGEVARGLRESDDVTEFTPMLSERINAADLSNPLWGAALLPGKLVGKVEGLAGVRSVVGGVKLQGNMMQVSLQLQTLDEAAAAKVVTYAESQVNESKNLLKNQGGGMDMQPLLRVLETIKAKAEGDRVHLSAGISADTVLYMLNLWGIEIR